MKKWKVNLYFRNQFIKRVYIKEGDKPLEMIYPIRVLFKKYLLGSWNTKIVVRPIALKYTDNKKKETHIEVELFGGV